MKCPKCQGVMYSSWNLAIGKTNDCLKCNMSMFDDGTPLQTIAMLHDRIKALEKALLKK